MSGHTKGPWFYGKTAPGERIILGGPSGRYVAHVQIHQTPRVLGLSDEPEREANARLIASAPELLAALKRAAFLLDEAQCQCSMRERDSGHLVGCWRANSDAEDVCAEARAAISKAEGREKEE